MSDTLNIEVTQVPEAPEFPFQGPYQLNGLEDNDTVVYWTDVNASDPEGSTLTWSLHTPPDASKGSLILSADGFTYSPVANQYGDSDFILTVSDSVLSSDLNFTVYVQPVNDPPSIEYDEVAYPYFNTGLIEIFESTESNRTLDIIQLDANDSQDGEPNPAGVTWNLAAKDDNASHTDVDLFYVSEAGMVSFLAFPDYETLLSESGNRDFEFKVYNLGNQFDFMKVGISESSRESLEEAGFNINIPISKVNVEPMVAPAKVRIQIRTPKTQGWTDAYHTLDFYAESDFSCKNGGCDRESQMITIYVRGIYLPGFEIIPALSMVALAAAVAGRRFINAEDEEEEWREAAPGL